MANSKKIKRVYVCPTCKGNGYLKFSTLLSDDDFIEQCHDCESQGEIYDYDDDFDSDIETISIH
tara:strand:+ start:187 stop:378 length:192 start_codon:yes stop_codon:yes gene_type:complete